MPRKRHEVFQQMSQALAHEQSGNVALAVSYWESALQLLPEDAPIQPFILDECRRLVHAESDEPVSPALEKLRVNVAHLAQTSRREFADEDAETTAQQAFRAMYQQSGGNNALALMYWKNILPQASDSPLLGLAKQDFCWQAHELARSGQSAKSIELYTQLLRVFPDFLEGRINLSLILYRSGQTEQIPPLFAQIPAALRENFLVTRYRDLFERIAELAAQFDQLPYAAIEPILEDLQNRNRLHPLIDEDFLAELKEDILMRERRTAEKRRKSLEEKAIAQTATKLAKEGISLGQRVTTARLASSEEIQDFLYDNHIRIAEALLNNPNITADDVLVIAQTTHVSEILSLIAHHHKWRGLYPIRMAILFNSQTLLKDAVELLSVLNITDLSKIFYKKSVIAEVRIRAKDEIQRIFRDLALSEKIAVIEASSGDALKLLDRLPLNLSSFLASLVGKFHANSDIIVNICRWKHTPEDVLAFIGRNAQLTAQIRIVFALLANPNTDAETAKTLLRKLPARDAAHLRANALIPAPVKRLISDLFPHLNDQS